MDMYIPETEKKKRWGKEKRTHVWSSTTGIY